MADTNKTDDDTMAALAEATGTDLAPDSTPKPAVPKTADKAEPTKPDTGDASAATDTNAAEPAAATAAAGEEDDDDDDSVKNVPVKAKKDAAAAKKDEVKAAKPAAEEAEPAAADATKDESEAPNASADESTAAKAEATETAATPAVPAAVAAPAAPPAAPSPAPEASPEVKELHAMFPAIEIGVIAIVLESVGGSQDRAIEQLLAMNDPDFRPDDAASRQAELDRQAALDAEFARALIMQEQEDERAQRRSGRHAEPGALPYQPRVRRTRPGQAEGEGHEGAPGQPGHPGQQGQQGKGQGQYEDQFAAIEERVTQIAEQGRQTFNTLFNRAKAKYDEFAQQQAAAAAARQQAQADGNGGPAAINQGAGLANWQNRATDVAAGAAAGASGLAAGATARLNALWGTGQQQQQQQGPERTDSASPSGRPPARWSPTDSYEDMHDAQPLSTGATINVGGRASPRDGASPPPSAQPGKIDMAKLGFLPKKRVDLMSASPAPAAGAGVGAAASGNASATSLASGESGKSLVDKIPKSPVGETSPHTLGDSDDEELDYTENPFDKK